MGFGDGMVATETTASLTVTDSLLEHNARAGLLYSAASGKVSSSLLLRLCCKPSSTK